MILVFIGNVLHKLGKLKDRLINIYLQHYFCKKMGKIGENVRFNGISKISGLEEIEIEDNVHLGDNAFIRGEGGLFVGANTHFSRNLVLYTHNHNYEGTALPYDNTFRYRKVIIERNVWVGMNVTILPGSHIKEGAIIGAGSVVGGVVEPLAIVGAPLAATIRYRNSAHYEKLDREKRYGGKNGIPIR